MLKTLAQLFESNRKWASEIITEDHDFFEKLSKQQSPQYLWIGCSDSRVPATEICGLDPGEMFVHRNIANQVIHTDLNCLSVVQYAVDILKVKDIIICGHYSCGGIKAALSQESFGLVDNWLRNIKETYKTHCLEFEKLDTGSEEEADRLTELNILKQVYNLSYSSIIQDAWKRGQELHLHGWVYRLKDGLLKDLKVTLSSADKIEDIFKIL